MNSDKVTVVSVALLLVSFWAAFLLFFPGASFVVYAIAGWVVGGKSATLATDFCKKIGWIKEDFTF